MGSVLDYGSFLFSFLNYYFFCCSDLWKMLMIEWKTVRDFCFSVKIFKNGVVNRYFKVGLGYANEVINFRNGLYRLIVILSPPFFFLQKLAPYSSTFTTKIFFLIPINFFLSFEKILSYCNTLVILSPPAPSKVEGNIHCQDPSLKSAIHLHPARVSSYRCLYLTMLYYFLHCFNFIMHVCITLDKIW